jgi:hypothetical protein
MVGEQVSSQTFLQPLNQFAADWLETHTLSVGTYLIRSEFGRTSSIGPGHIWVFLFLALNAQQTPKKNPHFFSKSFAEKYLLALRGVKRGLNLIKDSKTHSHHKRTPIASRANILVLAHQLFVQCTLLRWC